MRDRESDGDAGSLSFNTEILKSVGKRHAKIVILHVI
jgi:hypothetical protein